MFFSDRKYREYRRGHHVNKKQTFPTGNIVAKPQIGHIEEKWAVIYHPGLLFKGPFVLRNVQYNSSRFTRRTVIL